MGKKKDAKIRKKEKERKIQTEQTLSTQDDLMWMKDEGLSQLEGRIRTENWQ